MVLVQSVAVLLANPTKQKDNILWHFKQDQQFDQNWLTRTTAALLEKKKEKALSKQAQEMVFGFLKGNPQQAEFFGLPEEFEMSDVKPVVDVLGAKPSISLMMQLKMASMEAGQTKRPTIGDITKLREFLPGDKVIENGRIVDTTLRNEVLPVSDPLVQQLLQTDVGQSQLYGYEPLELISTNTEDTEAE